MREEILSLLKALSEAHAPPRMENRVAEIILGYLEGAVDRSWGDALGNLIVRLRGAGDGPRVMMAAHMDEVGLIIHHIDEDGFLYPLLLGGLDPRVLLGQRVVVHGEQVVEGCIGAKPPHITTPEEAKRAPELRELYIDIGARRRDEVEALGIRIGTPVTFSSRFARLAGGRVMGKAFDDRVGCVVEMLIAKRLAESGCEAEVYAVFTAEEELGMRGAAVAASSIEPRYAFVFEAGVAADVPGVSSLDRVASLGAGPAIRIMDATMLSSRRMVDYLVSIAEELGMRYQLQIYNRGGTDAGRIHTSGRGVETGVIAVPCRYLHSPNLVLDISDAEGAVMLGYEAIKRIKKLEEGA